MMIRNLNEVRISNNSTTLKKNEWLATKDAMRTKPNRYRLGLDTLVLEGPGGWQLERYLGKEGIEELLLTESEGETLHEKLDDLVLYGALHCEATIVDQGFVLTLNLTFVKNVEETQRNLAEYYVRQID